MVNCYSKEYLDTHDIIDKSFFTGGSTDAKKERDILARQLRKDGYKVTCKKWSFPDMGTKDNYTLYAVKEIKKEII
jgi:hypothetical protein